jgi:hypothetical protein
VLAQEASECSFPFHPDAFVMGQSGRDRFSILQGQSLNGASFTTVKELQEHVEPFIAAYNETAEPFAWTKISGASKNLRITQL